MAGRVTSATYEERYFAFIDVLGFSNIVKRSATDRVVVAQIFDALTSISDSAEKARRAGLEIEATSFSDNVVLSSPVSRKSLLGMFEIIGNLSADLLSKSMLFRGAIVKGKAVHNSAVVFGPALVDAYRLETSTSFHPRIMLSDPVFEDVSTYGGQRGGAEFKYWISSGSLDVPHLNPFAFWEGDESSSAKILSLVHLQNVVAAGLIGNYNIPAVAEKYKWLARKFNEFVKRSRYASEVDLIDLQ